MQSIFRWFNFPFFLFLIPFVATAQAPAQFNFQGIARNNAGKVIAVKPIALRFSLRIGSANGYISYREQRSTFTDSNGVFNAVIGGFGATNTIGALDTVFYTTGPKFLQVEMDTANGSTFVDLGATQLLSVPYAMFSNNSFNSGYATSSGTYFFEAVFLNSAILSSNDTTEFNGTLVFPRTNHNQVIRELITDANGTSYYIIRPVYDTTTGEFRAPTAGVYQFDLSLISPPNGELAENVFLTKNGVKIRYSPENNFTEDGITYFDFHQIHCILFLNPNDIIKIEVLGGEAIGMPSTFSGYKIY